MFRSRGMRRKAWLASAAALAIGASGEAWAQPAPEPQGGALEEVVVTASRREERLQDVPVSVTAVTNSVLKAAGTAKLENLTQVVPGLQANRFFGGFLPVIRGVGSSGLTIGDESNIATYIDGIYQGGSPYLFIDFVEVERIEVLRGPQGTVFGRNATGGLINVITPDPSFPPHGKVVARYGRMRQKASDYSLGGYLTGGLTDTLAMDIAAVYRGNGGFVKNLIGSHDYGRQRMLDLRSNLLFQPNDRSKIILTAEYANMSSQPNAVQPLGRNTLGAAVPGAIIPTEAWQSSVDAVTRIAYRRYNLALRTHFDLGGAVLETSSGYMRAKAAQRSDSDATNIFLGAANSYPKPETFSQEVRLISDTDGRLKWILGAYGYRLNGENVVEILTPVAGTIRPTTLAPKVRRNSYAGFGEGTLEVASNLFLTAGARYTTEDEILWRKLNGATLGAKTKTSFNKWTYRGIVRYNFATAANVYASYSTGFKSGVFNATSTTVPTIPVEPENISAFEIGLKADPTTRLRTNLAIFHYDYKDLQVQSRDATTLLYILQNAAKAKIYGGELEVVSNPMEDLNLRGSIAYAHSEYSSFPAAQTFVPLPAGGNSVVASNVSGNTLVQAPKLTFNLGFDWSHLMAGGRVGVAGNLFHSSRVYYDTLNTFSQKPYTLVNGEVSFRPGDKDLRLLIWAKNLTNEKVFSQMRIGATGADVTYLPPRSIGVGAEASF